MSTRYRLKFTDNSYKMVGGKYEQIETSMVFEYATWPVLLEALDYFVKGMTDELTFKIMKIEEEEVKADE